MVTSLLKVKQKCIGLPLGNLGSSAGFWKGNMELNYVKGTNATYFSDDPTWYDNL